MNNPELIAKLNQLADAVASQLDIKLITLDLSNRWRWMREYSIGSGTLTFEYEDCRRQLLVTTIFHPGLRGHKPFYRDGAAPITSIKVSMDKTAERIAKDIKRRLLPDYFRLLDDCLAQKERYDKLQANRQTLLERVAQSFGKTIALGDKEFRVDDFHAEPHSHYTGNSFVDGWVKLKIQVPIELAEQIAKLCAQSQPHD